MLMLAYFAMVAGANENCNGLLRQDVPSGSSFHKVIEGGDSKSCGMAEYRPRKCLGYQAPAEVLAATLGGVFAIRIYLGYHCSPS